jgi:hypothetical protein
LIKTMNTIILRIILMADIHFQLLKGKYYIDRIL